MVENDLKPCYVFDGKPPQLKSNVVRRPRLLPQPTLLSGLSSIAISDAPALPQLKKRFSNRQDAKEDEVEAKETGSSPEQALFIRFLRAAALTLPPGPAPSHLKARRRTLIV